MALALTVVTLGGVLGMRVVWFALILVLFVCAVLFFWDRPRVAATFLLLLLKSVDHQEHQLTVDQSVEGREADNQASGQL